MRDEVKNENIYKLGILTAEKSGSGFRPIEILQFPHKTIQEHSGADHIVKRLPENDRGPWETIVHQFHKDASSRNGSAEEEKSKKPRAEAQPTKDQDHTSEHQGKITVIRAAIQKLMNAATSDPNLVMGAMKLCRQMLDAGAFDEEVDYARVSNVLMNRKLANRVLTKEEQVILIDYVVKELLMETPKEWRAHEKNWLEVLLEASQRDVNYFKQYILDQKNVLAWVAVDPETAKQILIEQTSFFKNPQPGTAEFNFHYNQPYQYVSQDCNQLLNHVESNITLFRFIIGKRILSSEIRYCKKSLLFIYNMPLIQKMLEFCLSTNSSHL